MVRVEQLMTPELACIDGAQPIATAAQLMRTRDIGSLFVTRRNHIVGIVTESDIVRKIVALHRTPDLVPVEDIMSSPIISIDESGSIFDAADLMQVTHTRHLAVRQSPHIVGMLSVRDLLSPVAKDEL